MSCLAASSSLPAPKSSPMPSGRQWTYHGSRPGSGLCPAAVGTGQARADMKQARVDMQQAKPSASCAHRLAVSRQACACASLRQALCLAPVSSTEDDPSLPSSQPLLLHGQSEKHPNLSSDGGP